MESGNYTVVVTDDNGCTNESPSVSVTINPNPEPIIEMKGSGTFCEGLSTFIGTGSIQGATYQWYRDGQSIIGATDNTYNVTETGLYQVRVTDANGCIGISDEIPITVEPTPQPEVIPNGDTNLCFGDSIQLSVGGDYESIQWQYSSTNNGGFSGISGADGSFIYAMQEGFYRVTVSDLNSCSGTSEAIEVTVQPEITASIQTSATEMCESDGSVTFTATSILGAVHTWFRNGTAVATGDTYNASLTGIYTVEADLNGCTDLSDPISFTVYPDPFVNAGADQTSCTGETVSININSNAPVVNITANPADATLSCTDCGNPTVAPTQTTTYTITVEENGCTSTGQMTVNVNALPQPALSVVGPSAVCFPDEVALEATAGFDNYQFLLEGGVVYSGPSNTYSADESGNYTVIVTDGNGCTNESASVNVTINDLPEPDTNLSGSGTFCDGGSVTLSTTPITGASYKWFKDNVEVSGATSASHTVTESGLYNVEVTDANGCTGVGPYIPVNIDPNPNPEIVTIGDNPTCMGDSVQLSVNGSYNQIQWSFSPDGGTFTAISGVNQATYYANQTGFFRVFVSDGNACEGTSEPLFVQFMPTLNSVSPSDATLCSGETFDLDITHDANLGNLAVYYNVGAQLSDNELYEVGNGGATLLRAPVSPASGATQTQTAGLSLPANNTDFPVNYNIYVVLTNQSGQNNCLPYAHTAITVFPNPFLDAGSNQSICLGESISLNINSNANGISIVASPNSGSMSCTDCFNPIVIPIETTVYTIVVTNSNGCTATDEVTVTVNQAVTPEISGDDLICEGTGSITMNVSNAADFHADAEFTWYREQVQVGVGVSHTISSVSETGDYTVIVIDENGCTAESATHTATVEASFVVDAGTDQNLCDTDKTGVFATPLENGQTGLWTVVLGTGVTITDNTQATAFIDGMVSGECYTFRWTVTSQSGACFASDEVEVCVDEMPQANAGADQEICADNVQLQGNAPILTAVTSGAAATGEWTFTGGSGHPNPGILFNASMPNTAVTGLSYGHTYEFTWTITNGECSHGDIVTITVDALPQNVDAGENQALCNVSTTQLAASAPAAGETGLWTVVSGSGTSFNDATSPNVNVSGLSVGSCYTFQWTVSSANGTCTVSDEVEVCVDPMPVANTLSDMYICNTSGFLGADEPNVSTANGTAAAGEWTFTGGSDYPSAFVNILDANDPSTVVIGLQHGFDYEFTWTVSNGACSASDVLSITVDSEPMVVEAGDDQNLCNVTTANMAASPLLPGETGTWTQINGPNATIDSPHDHNSEITALQAGDCYEFLWTVTSTNASCTASDNVSICIDEMPIAEAGNDQEVCGNSTILQANEPTLTSTTTGEPSEGTWTFTGGTGYPDPTVVFNANAHNTAVYGLKHGKSYVFTWTIENGECSASDAVIILVDKTPIGVSAGDDLTVCNTNTVEIEAAAFTNTDNIETGEWTIIQGNNVTFDSNNSRTTNVSGLTPDECYTFRWTVYSSFGICSDYDEVDVCVDEMPTAEAGENQEVCETTAYLSAQDAAPYTGQWSLTQGSGVLYNEDDPNTVVLNVLPGQVYEFTWTVTNGECSATDVVTIENMDCPELGSIGDYVWFDANGDGVQDSDETGIQGVIVTLTLPDGATQTTTTDENGLYLFDELPEGDYIVVVGDGPDGTVITTVDTYNVDLAEGEDFLDADFGFTPEDVEPQLGTIGDYVWFDTNGDGIQDADEQGIEGVTVTLTLPDGSTQTTTTDENGLYLFDELPEGDYIVVVGDGPDGTVITTVDTYNVDLAEGEDFLDADFGFTPEDVEPQLGTIGDYVWFDTNGDGIQDADEQGIEGVTVTLTLPDGSTQTTTTDENGLYLFDELPEGDYIVVVGDGPDGTVITTVDTYNVDLAEGEDFLDADFGFTPDEEEPTGTIGDYVWFDTNGDGVQDADEQGIEGVTVTLTLPDGSTQTTTTDENGLYLFDELPEGDYIVVVGDGPDGTVITTVDTYNVDLAEGEDFLDADFGFTPETVDPELGTIGDYVWFDTNGDGIQDPDEQGIQGVTVTLTHPDGTTETTTTDENGLYLFDELPEGDYIVVVGDGPDGTVITTVDTYNVDLAEGEDFLDADFGFTPETVDPELGTIGDYVWFDTNGDGVQDADEQGIEGVTVTLTLPDGSTQTTTTDENGLYLFDELPEGDYIVVVGDGPDGTVITTVDTYNVDLAEGEDFLDADFGFTPETVDPELGTIGDYVWFDTNGDGVQDADEQGIEGVTVTLTLPDGSTQTTTTDENGLYLFDELPEGDYIVVVGDGPDGTVITTVDTYNVDLAEGEDFLDADFGFTPETVDPELGTIGDYVWFDTNGDGVQDADEQGIEGVTVTLTLPDGSTQTTTTDENGLYLFDELPEGDYIVVVGDGPDGTVITTVDTYNVDLAEGEDFLDADFGFTPDEEEPTGTIGDYVWFDTNGDGIQDADEQGIEGVTVTLTLPDGSTQTTTTDENGLYLFDELPEGDYIVVVGDGPDGTVITTVDTYNVDLAEGEDFLDADFGFTPDEEEPTGTIGDYVWFDTNGDGVQDADEQGIEGVTVTLTLPDGSTQTTTTDENGLYLFDELPEGDYVVVVGDGPDGTVITTVDTYNVDLAEGEDFLDADFGFTPETVYPELGTIGDYVWFDTNGDGVQDADEQGIQGVTVTLTLPDGSTQTTTTDENGLYLFDELPEGDYIVVVGDGPDGTVITTVDTYNVDLAEGEDFLDADFGFTPDEEEPTGTIGDYVWFDTNGDGIQDADEQGIEGVTVTLTLPDGSTQTTTTDENGLYLFDELPEGDYIVVVGDGPDGTVITTVDTYNVDLRKAKTSLMPTSDSRPKTSNPNWAP